MSVLISPSALVCLAHSIESGMVSNPIQMYVDGAVGINGSGLAT